MQLLCQLLLILGFGYLPVHERTKAWFQHFIEVNAQVVQLLWQLFTKLVEEGDVNGGRVCRVVGLEVGRFSDRDYENRRSSMRQIGVWMRVIQIFTVPRTLNLELQ